MAPPKRTQPPAMALPTGTAFRKRQRKGDEAAPAKKTIIAAQGKPNASTSNGNGKGKQVVSESKAETTVDKAAPLKSVLKKSTASSSAQQPSLDKGKAKASSSDLKRQAADESKATVKKAKIATVKEAQAKSTAVREAPTSLRVIVGSYERLLYGFHVTLQRGAAGKSAPVATTFKPLFSFAAHTSSVSAVAAAGADSKWLATGAGDETVRVWDLRRRKEVGGLTGHAGTIHALSFPARTYLLSADGSGLVNLYRTRDWALLKTLRGHTGRVNACVAHPSGKVALSVGKDGMLRMWDLMRGKGAGAVRLGLGQGEVSSGSKSFDEPLDVQWNKEGTHFAVLSRTEVAVYTTDMQKMTSYVVRRDDPKHKFGCLAWLRDDTLLIGNEAGEVDVQYVTNDAKATTDEDDVEATTSPPACRLAGHDNRVKGVRVIEVRVPGSPEPSTHTLAVTASSDGKIRVFDVTDLARASHQADAGADEKREAVGVHNTGGARLTCLDVVGGSGESVANGSRAATADDDDEEAEDDLPLLKDDGDEEDDLEGVDLDPRELDELNALLDVIEEARDQGIDVEGLSDFDDLLGEGGEEDDEDSEGDDGSDDFAESDGDDDDDEEEELEGESEQEQE